jgi:hypothetical protein
LLARCGQPARGGRGGVSARAVARHAVPQRAGRWAGWMMTRRWERPVAEAQPPRRYDPLVHPVAVTEHCVIGDQIRVPAAWCDMAGCAARFADPAALGEADNRARAQWPHLLAALASDLSSRDAQQPFIVDSPDDQAAPVIPVEAAGGAGGRP